MKLLADLHTHSKGSRFFHGKNSIEEMAREANSIGLKEIAITDHGFKHLCHTNKAYLKNARKVIDEINEWSQTKVLLGIEANIISEDGTIDVDNETLSLLDILVVGYHKMIKTDFAGFFGGVPKTEEARQKCTNAYLNAIKKYPITIISHPDSVLDTDLFEIGKACAEKGVMVELNNRHLTLNDDKMYELLASGCMFVVSSDAHSREEVGRVDKCFELIKKYNIPSELVANVEFSYDEKSEEDKAFTPYLMIYQRLKKNREEKIKRIEEKKRNHFTNNLSDEMESALKNIAKEKGLKYSPLEEEEIESEEEIMDYVVQNFKTLNRNVKQEFDTENENLVADDEVVNETDNLPQEDLLKEENIQSEDLPEIEEILPSNEPKENQNVSQQTSKTTSGSSKTKPNGFGFSQFLNDIKQDKE